MSAAAYTVPTDAPESDGTLEWVSTTAVVVEATAADRTGLGYAYGSAAAAPLAASELFGRVRGLDAMDVAGAWSAMVAVVRNLGRPGVCTTAISAVDAALWDLKARLLEVPLAALLGRVRDAVPAYGSGGFTSYSDDRLSEQLSEWVGEGLAMVKMKVGRDPGADVERVTVARKAIGREASLFVDANGAYTRKQAVAMAAEFAGLGVTWFEEPVSSDDLAGLRLVRDRAPAGMEVAAGEYGSDLFSFRRMLDAGAVDVLQVDATRCGGITGFLRAGALCEATPVPLSAHTAHLLHAHPCCALPAAVHVEWFHDHARVEELLFDGALQPDRGMLRPDPDRPGLGFELKRPDAEPFLAWAGR